MLLQPSLCYNHPRCPLALMHNNKNRKVQSLKLNITEQSFNMKNAVHTQRTSQLPFSVDIQTDTSPLRSMLFFSNVVGSWNLMSGWSSEHPPNFCRAEAAEVQSWVLRVCWAQQLPIYTLHLVFDLELDSLYLHQERMTVVFLQMNPDEDSRAHFYILPLQVPFGT